jgi:hypothetical protein
MLYQLSYFRTRRDFTINKTPDTAESGFGPSDGRLGGGWGRIRTFEDYCQQVYSLSPLATWVPILKSARQTWSWRWDLNPQPADYKSAALPIELRQQIGHCNTTFPGRLRR